MSSAGRVPCRDDAARSAPGMLASHYAPRARVRLGASTVAPGEALLTFGRFCPREPMPRRPSRRSVRRVISRRRLRDCSGRCGVSISAEPPVIAVTPVPNEGLGEAIDDRFAPGRRAALITPILSAKGWEPVRSQPGYPFTKACSAPNGLFPSRLGAIRAFFLGLLSGQLGGDPRRRACPGSGRLELAAMAGGSRRRPQSWSRRRACRP